jgi:hypothetical protein
VDVVDGEYQTLAAALDSSHDFESLQTSLDQFLKALHVQCFLSSPLVPPHISVLPIACHLTPHKVSKACADAIAVCAKMIRRLDSGVALTVISGICMLCVCQPLMWRQVDDIKETKCAFERQQHPPNWQVIFPASPPFLQLGFSLSLIRFCTLALTLSLISFCNSVSRSRP